ncbi:hypothetical protein OAG71_03680 [bacterium]|nr:hypothetical protein [bacterium]
MGREKSTYLAPHRKFIKHSPISGGKGSGSRQDFRKVSDASCRRKIETQTMKQSNDIQFITGMLIWVGLIAGGFVLLKQSTSVSPVASRQIVEYLGAQQRTLDVVSPSNIILGVGDPVFLESGGGHIEPIGMVSQLDYPTEDGSKPVKLAWVNRATIKFLSGLPPLSENDHVEYHSTSDSLAWVGKTMLNTAKRKELTELIVDAYSRHQDELLETFKPLIEQTIADGAKIIRDEIVIEIAKHQEQIEAIGRRYESEILEKDILPVLEQEVWPIIQEESQPLVQQIGMEIWKEVSVWRFGWRVLYDATPLPEKNLSQREFDRFLESKALPILKSHVPDAIELQKSLLAKISKNEKLKATLSKAGNKILNDKEVQSLMKEIFKNAIVDNEKLKQSIETTWRSDSAVAAMRIANRRLEPTVTEIGRALFGSPTEGITPEFARVLRNRVLHKDERWLVLRTSSDDSGQPHNQDLKSLPLRVSATDSEIPYFPAEGGDE